MTHSHEHFRNGYCMCDCNECNSDDGCICDGCKCLDTDVHPNG